MQTFTKGTLAQLVEQWTENPCVPGSIPGGTTKTLDNQFDFQGFFIFCVENHFSFTSEIYL